MLLFFVRHKKTFFALTFVFLFGATVSFANPPVGGYDPGTILDPDCAPGSTDCTVNINNKISAGNGVEFVGQAIQVKLDGASLYKSNTGLKISDGYIGQSSITTVGTIIAGHWHGDVIDIAHGGTGLGATPQNGEFLIGNGTGYDLVNLAGADGVVITNSGSTVTIGLGTSNIPVITSVSGTDYIPIYQTTSPDVRKKITYNDLFSGVLGSLKYQGTWDPGTNTPAIADSDCNSSAKGNFYIVGASGNRHIGSEFSWESGDWLICKGTVWEEVEKTNNIDSVFGRMGSVVAMNGDYTASQITNVPFGSISSITVQNAINELATEKEPVIVPGLANEYWRGDKTWQTLDTSNVSEHPARLYFTNARAVTALTGQNLSIFNNNVGYNSGTGAVGQIPFWNGTNTITGDTGLVWDNTDKQLVIGGGSNFAFSTPSAVTFNIGGNVDTFFQANIQNQSNGANASTDWIATSDNGNELANYVDMGINSSGYNTPSFNITGVNDAYLYSAGNDFAIGNASIGKSLKFFTGGTTTANQRLVIDGTGDVVFTPTSSSATTSSSSLSFNSTYALTAANTAVTTGTVSALVTAQGEVVGSSITNGVFNASGHKLSSAVTWPTVLTPTYFDEYDIAAGAGYSPVIQSISIDTAVTGGSNQLIGDLRYSTDGGNTFTSAGSVKNFPLTSGSYLTFSYTGLSISVPSNTTIIFRVFIYASGVVTSSRSVYMRNMQINGQIGTSTGSVKGVSIAGNYTASASNHVLSALYINGTYNAAGYTGVKNYDLYQANAAASNYFAGVVGIGNLNPTYMLDVGSSSVSGIVGRFTNATGSCTISPTTTSLSCSSDINLKKNIVVLADNTLFTLSTITTAPTATTLDKIMSLTPVQYNWKTEQDTDPKHTGFIAQQVEQIFPDLVLTDPETNLKSVNYMGFAPYLVQAVQEINVTIKNLSSLDTGNINSLGSLIKQFLADSKNNIEDLYAKNIHSSNQICINSTCINEDQLKQMLNNTTPVQQSVVDISIQDPAIPAVIPDTNSTQ
ncbi:MAG: tail fiber domain-containing protein [bacterium]